MIKQINNTVITDVEKPLIYPVFQDSKIDKDLLNLLSQDLSQVINHDLNKITTIHTLGKVKSPKIVFVGLGERELLDKEKFVLALQGAILAIDEDEFTINLQPITKNQIELASLAVDTVISTKYSYKESKDISVELLSSHDLSDTIVKASIIANAVNHTRTLVNTPSNLLNPLDLEAKAYALSQELNVEFKSYDNQALKEMKAGGILGVNQGSDLGARLLVLTYEGAKGKDFTALVGKGITFDTGGYSLKPANSMVSMKTDMGGAAAVLGAFEAIVKLNKAVNVHAIIATTENMINGSALKPDDVIEFMNGKTAEITNTDAEGRLVLADALVYACNLGVTKIFDVATLTGAAIGALGQEFTAVFSNDDIIAQQLITASKDTLEPLWQLPLSDRVNKSLKTSIVADLVNSTGKPPGATVAAEFLKEFVNDDITWVHLDIAGTSFKKEGPKHLKGATGVMVKTLVNAL